MKLASLIVISHFLITFQEKLKQDVDRQSKIDKAIENLKNKDSKLRIQAILQLVELKAREHVNEIIALLRDKDQAVLAQSVQAVGELGTSEHANEIAPLLTSGNSSVRENAARTLGKINAKEYDKEIVKLLKDKVPGVRGTAVLALGQLEAKQYSKELSQLQKDKASWSYLDGNEKKSLTVAEAVAKVLKDWEDNAKYTAQFRLAASVPVVEVMVNGKGPYLFILDTGANHVVLNPARVKKYGVKVDSGQRPNADIALGNAEVKGLTIRVVDTPVFSQFESSKELQNEKILGLLGNSYLSNFVITLDYKKETITLIPNDKAKNEKDDDEIPFEFPNNKFPFVEGKLNDKSPFKFMIDTGAAKVCVTSTAASKSGTNGYELKSITIGKATAKNIEMMIYNGGFGQSLEEDAIVGTAFLKHFITTINYKTKKIKFAKND